RAINHPLRLEIVRLIETNVSMNVTRIYIKLRIEQSVASQHLAILREAEILNFKRDGKEIHYSVNQERIQILLDAIKILKD
ncbi:MAG: ArsR/SmtB family transcription factor, partial [Bacteroidia bacterium]